MKTLYTFVGIIVVLGVCTGMSYWIILNLYQYQWLLFNKVIWLI